jgi:signal transduction histidine kinase
MPRVLLLQVVTFEITWSSPSSNLLSNAVKFTEAGSVRVVTRLIFVSLNQNIGEDSSTAGAGSCCAHEGEKHTSTSGSIRRSSESTSHSSARRDRHHYQDGNVNLKYSGNGHDVVSDKFSQDQHDVKHKDFSLEKGYRRVDAVRPTPEVDNRAAMPMFNSNVRGSAVIRVEIHDTGTGLKNSDLMR